MTRSPSPVIHSPPHSALLCVVLEAVDEGGEQFVETEDRELF
jgi:hypothetical protein